MKQFESYLAFRACSVAGSSIDTYRQQVATFFRWMEEEGHTFDNLETHHIAAWVTASVQEGARPGVVRAKLGVLKAFFAWAVGQGLRSVNPVDLSKMPKLRAGKALKVPFTADQYGKVLAEAEGFWPDACTIAWHTGLRMSDVACLKWASVDLPQRLLTVEPLKKRCFNEQLTIPMSDELHAALLVLWSERSSPQFVLPAFQAEYGRRRAHCSRLFSRLCNKCGLSQHTFHSFRHGFVTRLLNNDVDPITICSMTGHTLEQLKEYAHVSVDAKRAALTKGQKIEEVA